MIKECSKCGKEERIYAKGVCMNCYQKGARDRRINSYKGLVRKVLEKNDRLDLWNKINDYEKLVEEVKP